MRTTMAACAALALVTAADAASLKIGGGMLGGNHMFTVEDDTNAAILPVSPITQADSGFNQMQVFIGSEALSQVAGGLMMPGDGVALGIEAGIGLPLGAYEFALADSYKPPIGSVNQFVGDTITVKMTSVPLLVKALYAAPMGSLSASCGLSAGPTLIGWHQEELDTLWDNPATAAVTYTSNKGGASWVESGRSMDHGGGTVVLFTIRVTPGASFALSETTSIGAELPLAYNTTTIVGNGFNRTTGNNGETTYKSALSGIVNPQTDTWSAGGMSFGLNLVWTQRFGGGGAAPAKAAGRK